MRRWERMGTGFAMVIDSVEVGAVFPLRSHGGAFVRWVSMVPGHDRAYWCELPMFFPTAWGCMAWLERHLERCGLVPGN